MKTKIMELADAYEGMSRLLPEDVAKARAALEAEVDRVCKDAARYQFLKADPLFLGWDEEMSTTQIDAAIDAAMQGEK